MCSRGSTCTANRADVSSITRSAPLMRACRRSCARSTTVRAPEASETMRRPSSSSSSTWRTTPQRSAAAVPTMTMFSLTSSVMPGASRVALTVGATGSTTRRLPWSTSAHACCTPCESVEQRSSRSIAAKVSGGWANCSSCALALANSSPARVNACANAWFFACRRSFNCARFSCSSIAPRFPWKKPDGSRLQCTGAAPSGHDFNAVRVGPYYAWSPWLRRSRIRLRIQRTPKNASTATKTAMITSSKTLSTPRIEHHWSPSM